MLIKKSAAFLFASLVTTFAVEPASATTIVALSQDRTLISIDLETRTVTGRVVMQGDGRLAGIDVRPADGALYGVYENGRVAKLNPQTGTRRTVSRLSVELPNSPLSIDFNPTVDRLRIVARDGTNLRANVDDGVVVTDTALTTAVRGVAYVNSYQVTSETPAPTSTLLYDIGVAAPTLLYIQTPPNDGTLLTVGGVDREFNDNFGFDIARDQNMRNRGWIVANARLIEIDLTSGAELQNDPIVGLGGRIRDIAVLFDDQPTR